MITREMAIRVCPSVYAVPVSHGQATIEAVVVSRYMCQVLTSARMTSTTTIGGPQVYLRSMLICRDLPCATLDLHQISLDIDVGRDDVYV